MSRFPILMNIVLRNKQHELELHQDLLYTQLWKKLHTFINMIYLYSIQPTADENCNWNHS